MASCRLNEINKEIPTPGRRLEKPSICKKTEGERNQEVDFEDQSVGHSGTVHIISVGSMWPSIC